MKIIATKTLFSKISTTDQGKFVLFSKGEIFNLSTKVDSLGTVYNFYTEEGKFNSCYPEGNDSYYSLSTYSFKEISDYYMPLDEWRESRINSIIDE